MITLKNVNKYFFRHKKNEIHVIDNTSLELGKTGLVALLGPSGSGKTTLLNAIGGLDKVNSGEIIIDGEKMPRNGNYRKDKIRVLKIGYIFQDYNLLDNLTVFENVALSLKMIGIKNMSEIRYSVDYILNAVDMYRYKDKLAGYLSGGQRQRVGIARALVKNPDVIIADEPTGNLDSKNTIEIMNIIKKISQEKLVILVTHERDLAHFYASRIINLVDGKIVSDLKNDHENELDYRIDNKIYLKDFENVEKAAGCDSEVVIYSDKKEKMHFDIVVKNGNVYIKGDDNVKIEVVDENSAIEFVDDHYKKIKQDDFDSKEYDMSKLKFEDKIRYSSIYNTFTMLKTGLKKVLNYSKMKKILLLGFFFSAMFITYALSSMFGVTNIKDENFLTAHREYISIENKANKIEDYLSIEKLAGVKYVIPGDSIVNMYISNPKIWQLTDVPKRITGSLASINLLKEEDIVYGRYPSNSNEIVIDKYVLDRSREEDITIEWLDIHDYEDFIDLDMIKGDMTFKIVGISDTKDPCIYFYEDVMIDILDNTFLSVGANQDEIVGPAVRIEKYEDRKDDIVLKEGSWPVDDYEVIVNVANKNLMPIGKAIDFKIDGKELKVVGYYTSNEGVDEYLVNANTYKYNIIIKIPHMFIVANDKKAMINTLQEKGYAAKDNYENLRENYIDQVENSIIEALILAGVLLAISFIEIFLIIRASFLSRIKEVGIYRAIGVKKKDIYKMFLGEIIVITTFAGLPGVILMGSIMKEVASISFFGNMFVMNPFVAIVAIILLYLLNIFVGLVPVYSTIRKTPAEILSRTDVD